MMSLDRRQFVRAAAGAAALAATLPARPVQAQAAPFRLEPLSYPTNALEPFIDARTMEIHHDRHHAAYVNNLNTIAQEAPQIAQKPVEEVLANLARVPEKVRTMVRNNLGGHVNHTMFWQIMGKTGDKPGGEVLKAIDRDLGGLEKLQTDFNAAGGRVFGSGWVFVTVTKQGKLAIESRPNQDSPLMDGKRVLIGNDVWEHAYYLNYQNRRPDYLKAWWNTVDWSQVERRFALAKDGKLII